MAKSKGMKVEPIKKMSHEEYLEWERRDKIKLRRELEEMDKYDSSVDAIKESDLES